MEIITNSAEETERAGRELALRLTENNRIFFVAMYGDLGAGKTVFVRGIASVLSPDSRVKSPTYTIVNEYRRGNVPLFHFDLYRIEDDTELDGIGFEEYVQNGCCVAEWSENIGALLPENAVKVKIEKLGGDSRRITISEPQQA